MTCPTCQSHVQRSSGSPVSEFIDVLSCERCGWRKLACGTNCGGYLEETRKNAFGEAWYKCASCGWTGGGSVFTQSSDGEQPETETMTMRKPCSRKPQKLEHTWHTISVSGSNPSETVEYLKKLIDAQSQILTTLHPIPKDVAMGFFRTLGIMDPDEYSGALDALSGIRSSAISGAGYEIHIWYVPIDSAGEENNALYIHIDDDVFPTGALFCRLMSGTYLGNYDDFREKLSL